MGDSHCCMVREEDARCSKVLTIDAHTHENTVTLRRVVGGREALGSRFRQVGRRHRTSPKSAMRLAGHEVPTHNCDNRPTCSWPSTWPHAEDLGLLLINEAEAGCGIVDYVVAHLNRHCFQRHRRGQGTMEMRTRGRCAEEQRPIYHVGRNHREIETAAHKPQRGRAKREVLAIEAHLSPACNRS